ncbi:MAG: chorismate synthase [Thermodesulfobacteriota bacterium]
MGSTFGRFFQVTTFGESHGAAVGVVIDGVPAGIPIDFARIQRELDRRKPGVSRFVSPRGESDEVEILSGVTDGKALGSPVALLVRNRDVRSSDYAEIRELFRPGHADYTYFKKYGLPPQPGGGRASGRETVGRVAAGAVAKILLESHGITIQAYTAAIGGIRAVRIDRDFAERDPLRCPDPDVATRMADLVDQARSEGDSVGGIVEVVVDGVPPGLGDPVFHKLDAVLAWAMVSIGAVKGVELGAGFELSAMRGSQSNDQISSQGFLSNNAGGILGGISTGQPIVMRLAVKPTSSISKPQATIDIHGADRTIEVKGRHDPCLCPRICPVAEAMTALVLADALLERKATSTP